MDRINFGEFYSVRCHICNQNYLVRTGESPVVAQLAHAVSAQKEHDRIQDETLALSQKTWESVLVRKVLHFPNLRG